MFVQKNPKVDLNVMVKKIILCSPCITYCTLVPMTYFVHSVRNMYYRYLVIWLSALCTSVYPLILYFSVILSQLLGL